MNVCDHKCHKVGLNPWIEECPICRCVNPKFDPKFPEPETFEELLTWDNPDPALRPERFRNL